MQGLFRGCARNFLDKNILRLNIVLSYIDRYTFQLTAVAQHAGRKVQALLRIYVAFGEHPATGVCTWWDLGA